MSKKSKSRIMADLAKARGLPCHDVAFSYKPSLDDWTDHMDRQYRWSGWSFGETGRPITPRMIENVLLAAGLIERKET